jgi:hypothetical protein
MVMRFDSKEEGFMIRTVIAVATLSVGAISVTPAQADWTANLGDVTYENDPFAPSPNGITITFANDLINGGVLVTVTNQTTTALNGATNFLIHNVVFNIEGLGIWTGNVANFAIEYVSGFEAKTVETGLDSQQIEANPERFFDIGFKYDGSPSPGSFVTGLTSVYRITSNVLGFSEDSFKSFNVGEDPDFIAAVHYGYTNGSPAGSGKSGSTGVRGPNGGGDPDPVPLPASIAGLLIAGVGLFAVRRTFCIV